LLQLFVKIFLSFLKKLCSNYAIKLNIKIRFYFGKKSKNAVFWFCEFRPSMATVAIEIKEQDGSDLDKMVREIFDSDWFKERPVEIRKAYEQMPPWGFYEQIDTGVPLRHIGFHRMTDLSIRMTAYIPSVKCVIGIPKGYPLNRVRKIDKWTDTHLTVISLMPPCLQRSFLEPMGFLLLISPTKKEGKESTSQQVQNAAAVPLVREHAVVSMHPEEYFEMILKNAARHVPPTIGRSDLVIKVV
jgi:hypothetical protein